MASHQRARIVAAFSHAVATKGFAATTLADVSAAAIVSKKTIGELFGDKTGCLLAAYEAGLDQLFGKVATVFDSLPDPVPERTYAVVETVLGALADDPELARLCFVEIVYGGNEALERHHGSIERFADILEGAAGYVDAGRERTALPPSKAQRLALVGGVVSLIQIEVLAGRTRALGRLAPDVAALLLTPFLGPERAKQEKASSGPARRRGGRSAKPASTGGSAIGRPGK